MRALLGLLLVGLIAPHDAWGLGERSARQRANEGGGSPSASAPRRGGGGLGATSARLRAKTTPVRGPSAVASAAAASDDRPVEYNEHAGENAPRGARARDRYGNAEGREYDLARDGAFNGKKITVLHLYQGEGFDFQLPEGALAQKGFKVTRLTAVPDAASLERELADSSQLWVVSSPGNAGGYEGLMQMMGRGRGMPFQGQAHGFGPDHIRAVTSFYKRGRGLFLWGDNDPYHLEANQLAAPLFETQLAGVDNGDQVVGVRHHGQGPGIVQDHLLTTGIEQLYEGITVSSLTGNHQLKPLIFGSFGGVIAGYSDKNGRRAIVDGGFTRLYHKWDTAGTARYVTNAAAWLANAERFR